MIIGIEAAHANKIRRTGVEEYCFQVIQELKKIIPISEGNKVILYTNEPLRGELADLPPGWEAKVMCFPLKKGWSQIRLSWEFIFNAPDVFFAPGQLVPFICPKNTVVTVHDSAFMVQPESYKWSSRIYLKLMNHLLVKKAKNIIVTAQFNLGELKRFYGEKIGKKCVIIPLGYNEKMYNLETTKENWQNVLDEFKIKKPYLVSVGRLEEKKNTAKMVKAFNLVKKTANFSDLKLVLVGMPGVGYEQVEKEINSSPFKADIILPGFVAGKKLPVLMGQAEVFLFPSRYEGFGIPVLEAMAVGVPVITSRAGALPEVGKDVVLYMDDQSEQDLADKILLLLNDNSLRVHQVLVGHEHLKQFGWQKTAQKLWEIIKQTA